MKNFAMIATVTRPPTLAGKEILTKYKFLSHDRWVSVD